MRSGATSLGCGRKIDDATRPTSLCYYKASSAPKVCGFCVWEFSPKQPLEASSFGFGRKWILPARRNQAELSMLLTGLLSADVVVFVCLGRKRPRSKHQRQLTPAMLGARASSRSTKMAKRGLRKCSNTRIQQGQPIKCEKSCNHYRSDKEWQHMAFERPSTQPPTPRCHAHAVQTLDIKRGRPEEKYKKQAGLLE